MRFSYRILLAGILVMLALVGCRNKVEHTGPEYPSIEFGDGTASNPYQISQASHLRKLADSVNYGNYGAGKEYNDVHFILTNDIHLDCSVTSQWDPIGNAKNKYFSGHIDGAGYVVSGLVISTTVDVAQGFVGYLGPKGKVSNLRVEAVISGVGYLGGLVGFNYGTILGCSFDGEISGSNVRVGGVVGSNNNIVSACHNYGVITSTGDRVGGVAGYNAPSSTLDGCTNNGKISGVDNVGGIIGHNIGVVSNCRNYSDVISTNKEVGGIAGTNDNSIATSYNKGSIRGLSFVGGIVGSNPLSRTISNCYNKGQVIGTAYIGGIVGSSYGSVSHCYTTSLVSGTTGVGAISGTIATGSVIDNCYSLFGRVTGDSAGHDGIVKTAEQMTDFSFVDALNALQSPRPWAGDGVLGATLVNGGYPILAVHIATN